jgi:NitT/TauT family transport system ATP-binding protein
MKLFGDIHARMQEHPDESIDADDVKEIIILALPHENYEAMFETFVRWARFGNLFAYDESAERITLE